MSATVEAAKTEVEPPDPKFWQHYSPRFEFSISGLASLTVHIILFGLFFLIVARLMNLKTPKAEVPFRSVTISNDSGDDEEGSKGSGGGSKTENSDTTNLPSVSSPEIPAVELEKVKVSVSQWVPDLKSDNEIIDIVANSAAREKLEKMDQGLRDELLKGIGDKKGKGNEAGAGNSGQTGRGEGGDSDRAKSKKRALGWIIQFQTDDARNYLDQLAAMKATILFQKPGSKGLNDAIVFTDLSKGSKPKKYTDDMNLSALFFVDEDWSSIRGVISELGVDFRPEQMVAFFPHDVEEELAQKSMAFHNRKEEDIRQTTFKVLVVNGKYAIKVVSQVAKPGKR